MDRVIRPSVKKVLVVNILRTLMVLLFFSVLLIALHFSVRLETFLTVFELLGINLSSSGTAILIFPFIILVFGIVVFFSYLSAANRKYEFTSDRLIISRLVFLLVSKKDISYRNISKVSYDVSDFFNRLLDTGSVILDLSSMGEKELKMRYLDNPSKVARFVDEVIRSYQLKAQAEYTEKYRLKDLLDKSGI